MTGSTKPTDEPAASADGDAVKTCTACGATKPLSDFFGPYLDTSTRRRRWKGACKACAAERQAARPKEPSKYDLARERRLRDFPGSKVCMGCGTEKPLADFGRPVPKDRAAGRVALAFSPRCLACQSKAVAAWQARKAEDGA